MDREQPGLVLAKPSELGRRVGSGRVPKFAQRRRINWLCRGVQIQNSLSDPLHHCEILRVERDLISADHLVSSARIAHEGAQAPNRVPLIEVFKQVANQWMEK